MNNTSDSGRKNDDGKLRYDLISPLWEEGLAEIMTGAPGVGGAGEYGARNWEAGLRVSRVYAALRRHISAFIKGEDNDPKSGKSHLFHANACLMFLWAMPQIHPELDDRHEICIVPVDFPSPDGVGFAFDVREVQRPASSLEDEIAEARMACNAYFDDDGIWDTISAEQQKKWRRCVLGVKR